jgi:hypothetical protein
MPWSLKAIVEIQVRGDAYEVEPRLITCHNARDLRDLKNVGAGFGVTKFRDSTFPFHINHIRIIMIVYRTEKRSEVKLSNFMDHVMHFNPLKQIPKHPENPESFYFNRTVHALIPA